ncbi:uncharacterized protein TNCT_369411 [Trichonephila clavata]|uniref:C2H2-type domain-containing protein n=1 Tax=Trichonephila clavata TaxID=2740835 RepID=A0A8X6HV65_TRICU|nr:uncharacterized protein TNCT_369411 [Trichonephila clavata]
MFRKNVKNELKIAIYKPLAAASYIPLPPKLKNKKAILNIKNEDQRCFLWCVLAHLHPVEANANRVSTYLKFQNELCTKNLTFPTPLNQIECFEEKNKISINVFGFEKEIFPLKITTKDFDKHVNLLLISNQEKRHYCLIKSLNRVLSDLTQHKSESFYCNYCLHRFVKKSVLDAHIVDCRKHKEQKIKMPENKWLEFENFKFNLPVPYTIYADFESLIVKINSSTPDPERSFTVPIANHIPCGYAYVVIGPDGNFKNPPAVYRGENAVDHFLKNIIKEEEDILNILKKIEPIHFSDENKLHFKNATHCHICEKPLLGDRVRDHDHLTGSYRVAAHNICNINYTLAKHIPVVIHNLRGPIYIGFSILDISKILMYNFHYEYIKSKYNTNAKLLFTDTDSLCYEIVTQDVYEDMEKDLHFFDTSDYPKTHPLYNEINKKVLGKMKDELSSSLAIEFVGLKPKMYSLKSAEMEKKTAKGVSKIIIQHQIRHFDYKETLLCRRRGLAKAQKIASHNHIVQTVSYQKSTLSPFDSKRYILQDGISTLAYGHFKI